MHQSYVSTVPLHDQKACMKKISAIMLCFVLCAWKEAILSFLIHAMLKRGGKPK